MTTKHRHKTTIWDIGDTFKNPKFREGGRLKTFDRVVANPMWNQDWFTEADYANDEWDRFPSGAGFPGKASADWVLGRALPQMQPGRAFPFKSLRRRGRSGLSGTILHADSPQALLR